MSLRVDLSACHNAESYISVERDDDEGRLVWMTLQADDQFAAALLSPGAARAFAAALVHYANEAER